ncbi:MAG: META domain-containing protein [Bacteroidetes bacterium]|nr:MAG: META domain-containing protein [Bacteroidota bacterium]
MDKIILILITIAALCWVACNTHKNKTPDDTENSPATENPSESEQWDQRLHDIWLLTTLNGKELDIHSPRPQLELFPEEGRISGQGSCNRIFGQMTATAKSINFSQIGTTKKHCGEWMEREAQFIQELERAERYLIKDGELLVFWGDLLTMSFTRVD